MKTLFTITTLFLSTVVFSQSKLKSNWKHGYIINEEGKQKGIIILSGDTLHSPWLINTSVKFIYLDVFNSGKVKGKDKLFLKPKDIKGYGFDDTTYETITYLNPNRIGNQEEKVFMEPVEKGKISLYKFHDRPESEVVYANQVRAGTITKKYEYVLIKGNNVGEHYSSADIISYIEDCEKVKSKYTAGGYGFMPNTKKPKSKMGKLMQKGAPTDDLYEAIEIIISDYNSCNE